MFKIRVCLNGAFNLYFSFNIALSATRVKVECVFGQMKRKFCCLSKRPDYDPANMINVIKSCIFLWNFGLLVGDNKGYNPDEYIVADLDELNAAIDPTAGGRVVRDLVCDYLWEHK